MGKQKLYVLLHCRALGKHYSALWAVNNEHGLGHFHFEMPLINLDREVQWKATSLQLKEEIQKDIN